MGGKPRVRVRARESVRAAVAMQLVQGAELADLLFPRYDRERFDVALIAIGDIADAIANDHSGAKLIDRLIDSFLSESVHFIKRNEVLRRRLDILRKAIERWEQSPEPEPDPAPPTLVKPSDG